MRYDLMRPRQIRDAVERNLPVLLPLGVMEYHGEHLPVGMDMIAVTHAFTRLEAEAPDDMVLLPAFAYGAASYAVAGPEGTGTLHVPASALTGFAEALFAGLLRVGFRNIHAVIHHQSEDFAQGMPTDLAFRLGARQAIMARVEEDRGPGWWGRDDMAGYYRADGEDPFRWIRVHPLLPVGPGLAFPFDHAGQGETSLMLALAPETVEEARTEDNPYWYTASAPRASREQGEEGVRIILAHLRQVLGLDREPAEARVTHH
ncbi:MAG: creatinine amidohydrolase [Cereibacter sphaeroides]|uniref:Creatinine amidohydrolase n=1 Tax=Cereibacter sphaeroides TaxID=1063 RepID=A0A2W5SCF5_CERSP|nr:MAG: creatinine amidohydrolase [Cereibacter sphaeroides]